MKRGLLSLLVVCLLAGLLFTNCKKEQGFIVVFIDVKTESGAAVANARVRLFQDSIVSEEGTQADISDEEITTSTGRSFHQLPNMNAILFVEAEFDTLKAFDIIKLQPNEQIEKTVVVR